MLSILPQLPNSSLPHPKSTPPTKHIVIHLVWRTLILIVTTTQTAGEDTPRSPGLVGAVPAGDTIAAFVEDVGAGGADFAGDEVEAHVQYIDGVTLAIKRGNTFTGGRGASEEEIWSCEHNIGDEER